MFDTATGRLSGTPLVADANTSSTVTISVTDGKATASLAPFTLTVGPAPNTPPTILGTPATTASVNQAYAFQPTASDVDGDALTFSISGQPNWASFSTLTGLLSGTPARGGRQYLVHRHDQRDRWQGDGFAGAIYAHRRASAEHAADDLGYTGHHRFGESPYSFQPTANDVDGDALTFSIQGPPSWAVFDTATGRLSGTPLVADANTSSTVTISVTDGKATTSLAPFTLTVGPAPNTPPTILGTPATTASVNQAYAFQPTANDVDGDALTFSIQGPPSWAVFDTATGRLSGTPLVADAEYLIRGHDQRDRWQGNGLARTVHASPLGQRRTRRRRSWAHRPPPHR